MRITENVLRALEILEKKGPLTAKWFAEEFWPDHPGWKRVSNIGHGATRGVGMWFAGGGYLGKLRKAGLVTDGEHYTYRITSKGQRILKEGQ